MLKTQSGKKPSTTKAAGRAAGTSLTMVFLGAAVLAKLLDMEILKLENMGYAIMAVHVISVFSGAQAAINGAGREGMAAAGLAAGVYYLTLAAVNLAFFGGAYEGMGTTALLVILATAGAGISPLGRKRKHSRRRYKIPK